MYSVQCNCSLKCMYSTCGESNISVDTVSQPTTVIDTDSHQIITCEDMQQNENTWLAVCYKSINTSSI